MLGSKSSAVPVYGPTNPRDESQPIRRVGSVIGLKGDKEQYYRTLHADVWEDIKNRILKSNIRNYSIFLGEIEGKKYLFAYFEYVGCDFEADMQAMSDDERTQTWWQETDPCQFGVGAGDDSEGWLDMKRVFTLP